MDSNLQVGTVSARHIYCFIGCRFLATESERVVYPIALCSALSHPEVFLVCSIRERIVFGGMKIPMFEDKL